MTATSMLRIASAISLIFAAGHSVGGLQKWSPTGGDPVLTAMSGTHFPMMGVSRSYLDLFVGLGWTGSVFLLLQTILLWQLASLARTDAAQLRPMIAAFMLATLANGVIAWVYIFPVPAIFCAVLLVTLAAAYRAARPAPAA